MPTVVNGRDLLLSVRTSTGPDVYTTVGGQKNAQVTETSAEIDGSSKDQREFFGTSGRYKCTIKLDMLYIPTDIGRLALRSAIRAGTPVRVRTTALGGDAVEQLDCIVTQIQRSFPDESESVVNADLVGIGAWGPSS